MAASSCEPKRCSAYAQDLRWRMVYERQVLGLTYHNIGANLHVDPSTVYRTVQHFLNTGTVDKKKYNPDNLPRKLNDVIQLLILQLVLDRPGILLREIQDEVMEVAGVDLAESTICQLYTELLQTEDAYNCYAEGRGIASCVCERTIYIQSRYVHFYGRNGK